MKPNARTPIPFTDDKDVPCYRVSLDDKGQSHALIWQEDYDRLIHVYGVTPIWHLTPNGGRRSYVAVNSPRVPNEDKGLIPVARFSMEAKARERVQYVNWGALDLRRFNLDLKKGGGRAKYDAVQRFLSAKEAQGASLTA